MWMMLGLVLNDPTKLDQVLDAWEAVGIRGATILESSGLARRRGYLEDDMPLFPSLTTLLEGSMRHSFSLFAVVEAGVDTQKVLAATEKVLGDLSQPHTGIFFTLPVSFVKGLRSSG